MFVYAILGALALAAAALTAGAIYTRAFIRSVEEEFPPIGEFFEASRSRLHFTDSAGENLPVLVMIHGASGNLREFLPLVDRLQDRYRIICVDRPGSGYSANSSEHLTPAEQARQIAELLHHLHVESATWIGHSFGGSLVMAALLDESSAVAGVLLAGAAYHWEGGVDLTDSLANWPVVGPLIANTMIAPIGIRQLASGIQKVFAPDSPTPDYGDTAAPALYLRPDHFLATGRDISHLSHFLYRLSTRYGEIDQPVLMLWGEKDRVVPKWNHYDRLLPLLKKVEGTLFPGAGHMPHHSYADDVAGKIDAFVHTL